MFKSIQLGNFKAFGSSQRIPLKPITLIFGPNSSGKSSIIHSLAYLHHSLTTKNFDVHHTLKGGNSIDLGGFNQLVHKHDFNNRISFGFEISTDFMKEFKVVINHIKYPEMLVEPSHLFDNKTKIEVAMTIGIELDDQDKPLKDKKPKVYSYDIKSGGEKFLSVSQRPNNAFKFDYINEDNVLIRRIIKILMETSEEKHLNYELNFNHVINNAIINSSVLPVSIKTEETDTFRLSHNEVRFVNFLSALFEHIYSCIDNELNELEYLGPLRSFPPRILEMAEDNDPNFKAGGGFAWKKVLEDESVREKINKWLSSGENLQTPYNLKIKNLHTIDGLDKYYTENIYNVIENTFLKENEVQPDIWTDAEMALSKIKDFEDEISERKELVLTDLRTKTEVTHRDIGIGISQVLPVLVSALGNQNKTVAIEQPEIHLHPAIQAELGDVFIEGALKQKNSFILETHSEHLILRLLRRIRENNYSDNKINRGITPKDLMILYVEPKAEGAQVYEIPVDEEGEFSKPWPQGFFAERSKELFS